MAELSAQAYLEQESNTIAKVSRSGARALLVEADALTGNYRDVFAAIKTSPTLGKPTLDGVMDFMQSTTARINELTAEQKDPKAEFHPRLHMRAHRVLRQYEIMLAEQYRAEATILYVEFENDIRRRMQSGLVPTQTAYAHNDVVIDPAIEAAQLEFTAALPEWATTVPDESIVMTNKDLPLGFDFTGFDEAQDAKTEARLRDRVKDVTDIDPATGKPVDSRIFAAIEAATAPFPTLHHDEVPPIKYVAPEIAPAPVAVAVAAPAPAPAAKPDQWSAEVLAKAQARIEARIATAKDMNVPAFIKDVLNPLQAETLKELVARREAGKPAADVNHILDYADFLRGTAKTLQATIDTAAQLRADKAAQEQAKIARQMESVQPQMDAGATRARAQLAEIKVEAPAQTGWLARAASFFKPKAAAPVSQDTIETRPAAADAAPAYVAAAAAPARVDVWNSQNLMTASLNILKAMPKEAGPELSAFVESNLKKAQAAVAAELSNRGDTARQNPQANSNLYIFADFVDDQLRQATQKLEAAAPAPVAEAAPQVERTSFFSRMRDAAVAGRNFVSGLANRALESLQRPAERIAAHSTAAIVGVGAATVLGVGAAVIQDAPSLTGLAKSTVSAQDGKSSRFASGVVTYLPAAAEEVAAPVTAPAPAPVEATVEAPAAKAAPAVKASFKVQSPVTSNEPYKMPDSLKVAFADGTTSQFDKGTWAKACDQVGNQGEFCKDFGLKHS